MYAVVHQHNMQNCYQPSWPALDRTLLATQKVSSIGYIAAIDIVLYHTHKKCIRTAKIRNIFIRNVEPGDRISPLYSSYTAAVKHFCAV